jgi:hypothetical protein
VCEAGSRPHRGPADRLRASVSEKTYLPDARRIRGEKGARAHRTGACAQRSEPSSSAKWPPNSDDSPITRETG